MSAAQAREELEAQIRRESAYLCRLTGRYASAIDEAALLVILDMADAYAEETASERIARRAARSDLPRVHLDRDGTARCGNPGATVLGTEAEVDCRRCLGMMNGTYGVGHRQPDDDSCGRANRYRWHLRHEGKPVRCEPCLQAERLRVRERRAELQRAA